MRLLVNIYNPEDYSFFRRFYPVLAERKWTVEYVANGFLPYAYLKSKGEKVYIVRNTNGRTDKDFSMNFSVLTQRVSVAEASRIHYSVIRFLEEQYLISKWDMVIIPSGRLINHVAISDFCDKYNIRKIFVGYGNIPNRTFVDPEGTDMASLLYRCPEMLDKWDSADEYQIWRDSYLDDKFKKHVIGQARNIDFKLKIKKSLQIAACYLERWLGYVGENSYRFGRGQEIEPVKMSLSLSIPSRFVFFPMQVSTDAQIILNYDKQDILYALDVMVARAKEYGLPLVVKPHPAEIDSKVLRILNKYKENGVIELVNLNTFELIKNAEEVWTINSTVGLESMIVGTKVQFEGNSIYKSMTSNRLASYVMRYLVKIEYFSKEEITTQQFDDFFDEGRFLC